jgi:hypothetical protein
MSNSTGTTIDEQCIALANEWNNRKIEIHGVGGMIQVHTENGNVSTSHSHRPNTTNHKRRFIVRASTDLPGTVAFQVDDGTKDLYYLTVHMYGDECREDAAQALAAVPDVLADTIPLVVDYAIGRPTGETNFEGPGFNYSPMTASKNNNSNTKPTKLQLFTLVPPPRRHNPPSSFGVRSLFGSYWRSQHWDNVVSQSSHLLGDETWSLQRV